MTSRNPTAYGDGVIADVDDVVRLNGRKMRVVEVGYGQVAVDSGSRVDWVPAVNVSYCERWQEDRES